MTRVDDGELYLEIRGATEEQLRAGLAAVRAYISRCGMYVEDAMRSVALRGRLGIEMTEQDRENVAVMEEARLEGLKAAKSTSGTLGMLPVDRRTRNRPVLRDLFEIAA
jgi:hypothetical protein